MTAFAGTVAVALGASACSLVTSLDGLTGGAAAESSAPDGAGAGNGGQGVVPGDDASPGGGDDSSVPIGTTDAAGADGGATSPNDSGGGTSGGDSGAGTDSGHGTDAGGAADAHVDSGPPPGFCASQSPAPLFCDDFDESPLATGWDQITGTNGSASLSTAAYVSAPHSMLVSVNPQASSNNVDVAAYKSFQAKQGASGLCSFSFDIRIEAGDTSNTSDVLLGSIQLWNGSTLWDLEVEAYYDNAANAFDVSMSEDSPYVSHQASKTIPMNVWTNVAMTIVLPPGSGGAAAATMSINGTQAASAVVHVATSNPIPEAIVGTGYATSTSSGWALRYDNVTFDVR